MVLSYPGLGGCVVKYLIAGEAISTFQRGLDTGVLLAAELCRRGIPVDYLDLSRKDWRENSARYLATLPVSPLLSVDPEKPNSFRLGQARIADVTEYAAILQRKDPPVDDVYRGHAQHFALAPSCIIQMNHPDVTWRYCEHLLPQRYPEFGVPTFLCQSFDEFQQAVRSQPRESVAKPMHLFSGKGIEFFSRDEQQRNLKAYWQKWQPQVIVQPYLEEVTHSGDLRILVMNHQLVGWVMRKPKPGSRLANLHQGGSAHRWDPSPKQIEASRIVAKDLCPQGIYLLGLDFIGDFLTEVNITCPSAVPQINEVMGIRGESIIVDELEKLRRASLSPLLLSSPLQDHFSPIP